MTIVVRVAAFRAGDLGVIFSRFFRVMFRHLFGVMLSHLFKEGGENVPATPAWQMRACSFAIRSKLTFLIRL